MSSIDERVVDMQFNNGQFERGIKTSVGSLDALKKGLQLEGATKGLANVDAAAKRFSLAGMAQGIDAIASKFTSLGIIGTTALATLVSKATSSGLMMAKSLTLDPIQAGFAEYELKLGSIQTILANTAKYGTTLGDVSKSLNELNDYADKTIYNFGEMTRNIGLFTNAGIRVEDATSMIKGFSNAAAASGTSSQGAASAAYQLSQALSAGKITLMDWKSLTNVGMGNKNMQQGIIDIAGAMGTMKKAGVSANDAQKNFNGTLEKGWLTADVMSNYLKIMAGDMTDSEMAALGLSKSQIKLFKEQQATAEAAATKVRTFTQLMGTLREAVGSGWSETFEIIFGDFNEATELFTGLSNTIGGIFNGMSKARNDLLRSWDSLGGRTAGIDAVKNAWAAVMSVVKPIKDAFREIFPPTTGKQLYDITVAIRDFMKTLTLSSENGERLKNTFKGVFAIFSIGWTIVKEIVGLFFDLFSLFSGAGPGGILATTSSFADLILKIHEFLVTGGAIHEFFAQIGEARKAVLEPLIAFFGRLGEAFGLLFRGDFSGFIKGISSAFAELTPNFDVLRGHFESLITFISTLVNNAKAFLTDIGSTALAPLINLLDGITQTIQKLREQFKFKLDLDTSGIRDAAGDLGFLETAGKKLSSVWDGVKSAFAKVKEIVGPAVSGIGEVFSTISDKIVEFIQGLDFQDAVALLNTGFFIALYMAMRSFMSNLKGLVGDLSGLIDRIGGVFDQLTESLKTMQQNVQATIILKIAVAVGILVASIYTLSKISPGDLKKALTAITVILGQLMLTLKMFDKFNLVDQAGILRTGASLVLLAIAVKILASAVKDLAALDWGELAKGLIGVGGLLASLAFFTKIAEVNKGAIAQSAGLILLAVAIRLLAESVKIFGTMGTGELIKGITAMGTVLAALAVMVKVMNKTTGIPAAAAGLLILSAALAALSLVLRIYAAMDWGTILKGLLAASLAIAAIGLAMKAVPGPSGAAALLIVSGALLVLAGVLKVLGGMSVGEIAKAIIVLAASLLIIVIALNAMAAALPGAYALIVTAGALAIFAAAMVLLSEISWEGIGKGLAAIAGLFVILGLAGLILTPVLPSLLLLAIILKMLGVAMLVAGAGFLLFAAGFAVLAAIGAAGFAVLIAGFMGLLNLIPLFAQQVALGMIAFAKVIGDAGPVLVDALSKILISLLQAIDRVMPKFFDTAARLILGFVAMVVKLSPKLHQAGLTMLIKFLQVLQRNVPAIAREGTNLMIKFIQAISREVPRLVDAGYKAIIKFINELTKTIDRNSEALGRAGGRLAAAIVRGMVKGLAAGIGEIAGAARRAASAALEAAKSFLGINSPSKEFMKIGMGVDEGFALGIDKFSGLVTSSTEGVGKDAIESMRKTIVGIAKVVDDNVDANPVISPVLDLTDLKANAGEVGKLLKGQELSVGLAYAQAKGAAEGYDRNREVQVVQAQAPTEVIKEVKFEQTITSPKAISHVEAYRQTSNLLARAAKEL